MHLCHVHSERVKLVVYELPSLGCDQFPWIPYTEQLIRAQDSNYLVPLSIAQFLPCVCLNEWR